MITEKQKYYESIIPGFEGTDEEFVPKILETFFPGFIPKNKDSSIIKEQIIKIIESYIPKYDLESYKNRTDYTGSVLHGREIQKYDESQHYQNLIKDIREL